MYSFSFHALRLSIIKAYCDVPEGGFSLWNNHEPLNNASLQLCFHISWTNFAHLSAPGTTASSYDNTLFHNFHQKLVMREVEKVRESIKITSPDFNTPLLLLLLFYFWHSKYSSTKIFTVWCSFLGWREVVFTFSLPPTMFCFKVNFVLYSTRNTLPRALETQKEYQFSFRKNYLIAISVASDAHMLNLCTHMLR